MTKRAFFFLKPSILKLSIIVTFLNLGCNRELKVENSNNKYFNHAYTLGGNQACRAIYNTEDNGFLIIGIQDSDKSQDANEVIIIKTDLFGKFQWQNTLSGDSFNSAYISKHNTGNIYVCPSRRGSNLYKLNKEGHLMNKIKFYTKYPFADNFSYPFENERGEILFASSSRYLLDSDKNGTITIFNSDGSFKDTISIIKEVNNYHSSYNCIYKMNSQSTIFYYGIDKGFTPYDKMFIAKQQDKVLLQRVVVDPNNLTDRNISTTNQIEDFEVDLKHLLMTDGKIMLYNTQFDLSGKMKGFIAVFDDNLNKIWEITLKIGVNGTRPFNISLCPDGNYLICGSCQLESNLLIQPFACKIDSDGKILWTQIYTYPYASSFSCGIQHPDGSIVFGGTTNSFGEGKNQKDIFILKTDKDGNLK